MYLRLPNLSAPACPACVSGLARWTTAVQWRERFKEERWRLNGTASALASPSRRSAFPSRVVSLKSVSSHPKLPTTMAAAAAARSLLARSFLGVLPLQSMDGRTIGEERPPTRLTAIEVAGEFQFDFCRLARNSPRRLWGPLSLLSPPLPTTYISPCRHSNPTLFAAKVDSSAVYVLLLPSPPPRRGHNGEWRS